VVIIAETIARRTQALVAARGSHETIPGDRLQKKMPRNRYFAPKLLISSAYIFHLIS
jgi:hypothetical protein